MLPGYLHFDVRRGLRADMLNASMLALLSDNSCVRTTLDALGLKEISLRVVEDKKHGFLGQHVHFYVGSTLVRPRLIHDPRRSGRSEKTLPRWDRSDPPEVVYPDSDDKKADIFAESLLVRDCINGQEISFDRIRTLFLQGPRPTVCAIALKIIDELMRFCEGNLEGEDALWLVCHLAMLCAQVDALDPKFISASNICIGRKKIASSRNKNLSVTDDIWINELLMMLPVIEVDEILPIDVLALAFIKILAGQIGVRGESTILKIGRGLDTWSYECGGLVEALWCEADLPNSMNECGPSNNARINFWHEVSGLVKATMEMPHLCSMLSLHGAKSISWQLVHGTQDLMCYRVNFLCNSDDKHEAIEAFLIKGGSNSVCVRMVEHHELNRRLVAVPVGSGNKTSSIRFFEYTYYDKTVRVEPLKEDLDQYIEKTDYSVDVARSDLLLAWKKWRGKVAGDEGDQAQC
jgi:hypothetical protein